MQELPGAGASYPLRITLALVTEVETAYGSLYQIAEGLLGQTLLVSTAVNIVKTFYRHAGCLLPEEELDSFLLRQPCIDILIEILADILSVQETKETSYPPAQFLNEMMDKFPDKESS